MSLIAFLQAQAACNAAPRTAVFRQIDAIYHEASSTPPLVVLALTYGASANVRNNVSAQKHLRTKRIPHPGSSIGPQMDQGRASASLAQQEDPSQRPSALPDQQAQRLRPMAPQFLAYAGALHLHLRSPRDR
eukprot:1356518-Amphidinium_carterae.1